MKTIKLAGVLLVSGITQEVWQNGSYVCTLSLWDDTQIGAIIDKIGSFMLNWRVDKEELIRLDYFTDDKKCCYDLVQDPEEMDWLAQLIELFPDQLPEVVKNRLKEMS